MIEDIAGLLETTAYVYEAEDSSNAATGNTEPLLEEAAGCWQEQLDLSATAVGTSPKPWGPSAAASVQQQHVVQTGLSVLGYLSCLRADNAAAAVLTCLEHRVGPLGLAQVVAEQQGLLPVDPSGAGGDGYLGVAAGMGGVVSWNEGMLSAGYGNVVGLGRPGEGGVVDGVIYSSAPGFVTGQAVFDATDVGIDSYREGWYTDEAELLDTSAGMCLGGDEGGVAVGSPGTMEVWSESLGRGLAQAVHGEERVRLGDRYMGSWDVAAGGDDGGQVSSCTAGAASRASAAAAAMAPGTARNGDSCSCARLETTVPLDRSAMQQREGNPALAIASAACNGPSAAALDVSQQRKEQQLALRKPPVSAPAWHLLQPEFDGGPGAACCPCPDSSSNSSMVYLGSCGMGTVGHAGDSCIPSACHLPVHLGDCIRVDKRLVTADGTHVRCQKGKGVADALGTGEGAPDIKPVADQEVQTRAWGSASEPAVPSGVGIDGEWVGAVAGAEPSGAGPSCGSLWVGRAAGQSNNFAKVAFSGDIAVGCEMGRGKQLMAVILLLAAWAGVLLLGF